MRPMTQRLASEQGLGARAFASQGRLCHHSRQCAVSASLRSRLRCLSFQSTTSAATGKQPPSTPPPSLERPPTSQHAASSSQQQSLRHEPSQGKAVGGTAVKRQDAASGAATAAGKQQDANRIQASEDATTSGREYWQVSYLQAAQLMPASGTAHLGSAFSICQTLNHPQRSGPALLCNSHAQDLFSSTLGVIPLFLQCAVDGHIAPGSELIRTRYSRAQSLLDCVSSLRIHAMPRM